MVNEILYHIRNFQHTYDQRPILDIDELAIRRGSLTVILGPNGVGKSTLLRMMAFLEEPTQGDITIALNGKSQSFSTIPIEARRQIGLVFQRPVLLSRSVLDNIKYGVRIRGKMPSDEMINDVLDRFNLEHLANTSIKKLSGGELQRVALARSFILNLPVLLLDEPTANLDPSNVRLIEALIQEQHKEHNTTIVLVTHNIFQARRLATDVIFLYDRRIIEQGSAESFFNNPANPITSAFLSGELVT